MVQHLVHPVAVAGGCLVDYVATEVGLTPLPDQAREAFPQRLNKSLVRIAGSDLDAGEAPALELPDEPAPSFGCLSEGRQRSPRISRWPASLMPTASTRGRRSDRSLTPNLQVHRIQHQERIALLLKGTGGPGLNLLIQFAGEPRGCPLAELPSTELSGDLLHAARGDALVGPAASGPEPGPSLSAPAAGKAPSETLLFGQGEPPVQVCRHAW